MSDLIVNKVAGSGLITLDLEKYLPRTEIVAFDLKDFLFMGLILKEKDYREQLKNTDWEAYRGKAAAIGCSVDAIIPVWAYMLAAAYLEPVAADIYMGTAADMYKHLLLKNLAAIDPAEFNDQRVVVKGCGDIPIEPYAYAEITRLLRPVAKSIMYGEPCSTVPIYKKK
ncbi:MAG TPA: DUF2480 family protein [Chitinophagaceae bacterium]|jgi:hypothetical protein|nr:DUF2480 family protein [Chitinophagaceae bacterium]